MAPEPWRSSCCQIQMHNWSWSSRPCSPVCLLGVYRGQEKRLTPNQRAPKHDVIMARQKPPASSYYGFCPFRFINSYNSLNTNSIKVQSGLNDGKICPLYVNTSALFLCRELTKSHPIPDLSCGVCGVCPHPITLNLTLLY